MKRIDSGHVIIAVLFFLAVAGYLLPVQAQPFPDFASNELAAGPIIETARGGRWSDPGTWDRGRVPEDGDVVRVRHWLALDVDARVHTLAVERGGFLRFWPRPIHLQVVDLIVQQGGGFSIGSERLPARGVTITFLDRPLRAPEQDPEQHGNGLLVLGYIGLHGERRGRTWHRLAVEPRAGDTSITLESTPAWQIGDQIVIADTREVAEGTQKRLFEKRRFSDPRLGQQWETRQIAGIDDSIITLDAPLEHDHLGARDHLGELRFLGHVGVLTRGITIRSENPHGVRGHTQYMHTADVDIRGVLFQSLGRTTNALIDPISNHTGRYPVHFHMLEGDYATNCGARYCLRDSAVVDGLKWAVTAHRAPRGIVQNNVVFLAQGSGIIAQEGSELDLEIRDNFVLAIQGTNADGNVGRARVAREDYARGGVGIWATASVSITGNVVANASYGCYVQTRYYIPVSVPAFEPREFADNECYSLTGQAHWMALAGYARDSYRYIVRGLRAWHVHGNYVRWYHVRNAELTEFEFLGQRYVADGIHLAGPYECEDCGFSRGYMAGLASGLRPAKRDGSDRDPAWATRLSDSVIEAQTGVLVDTSETSTGGTPPRHAIIEHVQFATVEGGAAIKHRYVGSRPLTEIRTTVRAFQGVDGDNFEVWHEGSLWACASPETRPGIVGWVCP